MQGYCFDQSLFVLIGGRPCNCTVPNDVNGAEGIATGKRCFANSRGGGSNEAAWIGHGRKPGVRPTFAYKPATCVLVARLREDSPSATETKPSGATAGSTSSSHSSVHPHHQKKEGLNVTNTGSRIESRTLFAEIRVGTQYNLRRIPYPG